MSANVGHINEDITGVANVQGLTTDPIGLRTRIANKYKKKNEGDKPKTISFKEYIELYNKKVEIE